MEFKFNNQNQAREFISNLKIGQVLKVEVITNLTGNVYLIAYKNYRFTAYSDIDLLNVSCWLNVVSIEPYPKLRVLIKEKTPNLDNFFEYAITNNKYNLSKIPVGFLEILTKMKENSSLELLDNFYFLYHDVISQMSLFPAMEPFLTASKNILLNEIMDFYEPKNLIIKPAKKTKKKNFQLLFTTDDVQQLEDWHGEKTDKELINMVRNIEVINNSMVMPFFKVALLFFEYRQFYEFIPVECYFEEDYRKIVGYTKSGNYKIFFEAMITKEKSNVTIYTTNNPFLNQIKKKCSKFQNENVQIYFEMKNRKIEYFTKSIFSKSYDWDVEI